ncbi:ADP-ribosylation factor-binding protein GGA2-like isoform X2 [Alosa alosa]|uniref:ADP-ribosylation factor-binding protein GGA2-like isoform X2 n=1 Tax=Alosa alosa TaxID=278164 RepID=UPI0020155309|nr:ADP-ribosylation factor-binding protein GGA2-like isoform X2 [Alosa alosa]
MATQTNMATGESTDTLETWLNKVTDPSNTTDRWDCIQGFYEQVNREPDGPQVATRLLAHKIQSPQEKEALQALTLLEACMNYCGKRFQSEAAKFRFLNELIKVLSPKYLGSYSPEAVKQRVTEVLYSWTTWLKDEAKVQEAYRMLKKQGVIKKDPKLPATIVMPPPTQRPEGSLFDDEDKSKLLARLLKSNKAEDLQTANRLIKNTIKEEQEKVERVSRRISTLEEVEKSTAQLRELLEQHRSSSAHMPATPHMKTVYERCDKLRPNLFRLASDTVDDDEALGHRWNQQ